jgi:uncharacterized phage protein (TIGR01671 family)
MREIKFRAWNVEHSLYWDSFAMSSNGYAYDMCYGNVAASYKKEDVILEQFTGLLDKNGKEIYCGDVVKESMLEVPLQVKFDCGQWILHDGKGPNLPLYDERLTVEVIGNIHESPELLEA